MTNWGLNKFLPPILIRIQLLQTVILQQSFITLRPRMQQSNRPVKYAGQVPNYMDENQNPRNANNLLRIRGPHSSNSDPLHFLKRKQNNVQKQISFSSEEEQLEEKIEKLRTEYDECKAHWKKLFESYQNYQKGSLEAQQRGDKEMQREYQLRRSECVELIKEIGKQRDKLRADIQNYKRKLQQLQASKI